MEPTGDLDRLIAGPTDRRGRTSGRIRALCHDADPDVVEERRYGGLLPAAAADNGAKDEVGQQA